MKFKIAVLAIVLIVMMIIPFFLKGPDGKSLLRSADEASQDILSTEQTRQTYVKWQDKNGVWHFGDEMPEGIQGEEVKVDTAANVIRSVKPAGQPQEKDNPKTKEQTPSLPVPLTVSPEKVSEMMDDARNVEKLMEQHTQQLEQVR